MFSRGARGALLGLLLASIGIPEARAREAMDPALERWVQARVREIERALPHESTSIPAGQTAPRLYSERPPGETIPEFVAPTSLAPLVRAVREGVVNIRTERAPPAGGHSTGSGFIISPQGYVVTNNHVVEQAARIHVTLADGRQLFAGVVGRDPSTDVALLRVQASVDVDLPFVYLGDSDRLEVGDWVVAIGNPFGLDHSVSHGMISAKERVIGVGLFDDFIQTDALINPGNSGGPLFNMQGEVVGVNTAIVSQGQGIGFAVPINMVKDLLPNLQVNGRLARGWLGVNIREQRGTRPRAGGGAVVTDVFKGSPAARAGLMPGDQLIAVNGRVVESYLQLLRRIALLAPGNEVTLSVRRGGESREVREVKVVLSERPAPEALQSSVANGRVDALGMIIRELAPDAVQRLSLAPGAVVVAGVLPRGPAELAGLQAGDAISEVDKRRVHDVGAFRAALERADPTNVLLRVHRADQVRYVSLRLR